jgi:hypothetical protein
MAKRLDTNCSALAFYGFLSTEHVKAEAYRKTVKWFEHLGYQPTHLGVYNEQLRGRTALFPEMASKLTKGGFSKVDHLDIFHVEHGRRIDSRHPGLVVGFRFSADNEQHGQIESHACATVEAVSSLLFFPSPQLQEIAQTILETLKPEYGIGYHGDNGYATGYPPYPADAQLTPEEEQYAEWVSAWGDYGMPDRVYRQGLLRDVYQWNFVSMPVLDAPVGKTSLEKWIGEDPRRGTLTRLTKECTFWDVEDKNIPEVRKVLWDAGRIFNSEKISVPPSQLTSQELLRAALGGRAPEDVVVIRGSGEEIPTEEVKKLISKPKNKHK